MEEKIGKINKKEKIYFITQIYYFNVQYVKIEFWNIQCVVKWYGIIDKVTFSNDKMRQSDTNALRTLGYQVGQNSLIGKLQQRKMP